VESPAQGALNVFIGWQRFNLRSEDSFRVWSGDLRQGRGLDEAIHGRWKCSSLEFHPVRKGIPLTETNESYPPLEDLYAQAVQVAQNSYSPHSHFRVGAALKLTNGVVVTGTNVENVSYGLTICAERSALVSAVSQFGPEVRIAAVAVANLNNAASPPCGACRQVLAEFVVPGAPIVFPAADGQRIMPFIDLLPLAFDMKL